MPGDYMIAGLFYARLQGFAGFLEVIRLFIVHFITQ